MITAFGSVSNGAWAGRKAQINTDRVGLHHRWLVCLNASSPAGGAREPLRSMESMAARGR